MSVARLSADSDADSAEQPPPAVLCRAGRITPRDFAAGGPVDVAPRAGARRVPHHGRGRAALGEGRIRRGDVREGARLGCRDPRDGIGLRVDPSHVGVGGGPRVGDDLGSLGAAAASSSARLSAAAVSTAAAADDSSSVRSTSTRDARTVSSSAASACRRAASSRACARIRVRSASASTFEASNNAAASSRTRRASVSASAQGALGHKLALGHRRPGLGRDGAGIGLRDRADRVGDLHASARACSNAVARSASTSPRSRAHSSSAIARACSRICAAAAVASASSTRASSSARLRIARAWRRARFAAFAFGRGLPALVVLLDMACSVRNGCRGDAHARSGEHPPGGGGEQRARHRARARGSGPRSRCRSTGSCPGAGPRTRPGSDRRYAASVRHSPDSAIGDESLNFASKAPAT